MIRSFSFLSLIAWVLGVGSLSAQTQGDLSGTDFKINSQSGSYSVLALMQGSFRVEDDQLLVTINQANIRLVNSDPNDPRPRSSYITAILAVSKGRGNTWDVVKKSKRVPLNKTSPDRESFLLENVTFTIPLPETSLPLSSYWLVFQVDDSIVESGTRLTGTYYVQSERTIFAKM